MRIGKLLNLKTLLFVFTLSVIANNSAAQNNVGIFFQAVARDNFSNPAKSRKIYVQSSVIQTSTTGTKVLIEEHQTSTDATGMFSISVGNGTRIGGAASGLLAIDWSNGPFFLNLKIAITPVAGSAGWDYTKEFVDMGTTSFGAVPYALYAANAAGVNQKLNIADTAKMLSPYAKSVSVQNLSGVVDTKLAIKDTLAMLAPYARVSAVLDSGYINAQLKSKVSLADSGLKYVTPTDMAILSNRVSANVAAISAEESRATAAELALSNRVTSNTASITANTNDIASTNINVASNTASIAANTTAITTEVARATAAELALSNRVTSNTASITAEVARATAAELVLTNSASTNAANITAETNRATAAELALSNRIASNTASITANTAAIAAEVTRATAAELALTNNGVSSNTASITAITAAIAAEVTRATAAELALTNSVAANTASITANTNSIASLNTSVAANTASITANASAIAAEVTRATAAELALSNSVAANTTSITANTSVIAAEVTRATAAELALTNSVAANTASITANTNSIASLNTSVAANTASITANASAIAAEVTRATAAELALTNSVAANTASITANTEAINLRATTASPSFTGTPTAPTAAAGTNTTQLATTAFVTSAISTVNASSISGTVAVANGGTGVTTSTGSGNVVLSTSPTLVTPNLGTPSTLVGTNISGTAANLTAGNVTTNANLTGDVTSVGNTTTLAASGVVSGTYGSSTAIPTFTVDSKGRLTSASTTSITAGVNTLTYTNASSYANGGTISGTTLTLAAADATNPGLISTGTQTIVGAKTFSGGVTTPIYASTPQALTSGSTITWNPANGLNASVTLNQNSTLSFSTTPSTGSYGTLVVTQGSGNNTLTLPTITNVTNKVWGSTSTSTIALSTGAGAVDIVNFYYDGTSCYWNVGQGYGQISSSSLANLATGVTGTLPVANGGTGVTTLTGLVKGNGTNVMTAAVAGTDYQAPLTLTTTGTGAATLSGTTLNIPTVATTVNASSISGTVAVANGGTGVTTSTGSGSVVLSTSPTLVTPNLGTPSTLVGTNISGTAANLTAGNVTTNANLTGDVTSVGNATTLSASGVVSGTYGSSTAIPTFTVDSKGRITVASNTSITAGVNTLTYTTASSYANGGTISGTTLTLAAANETNPGLISTGAQTIAGAKTFNGNLSAATVTTPIYASTPQALTSGSTISWNPANGLNANVTLNQNSTLSFSSTPASGSYGTLVITQDATGGRTITLPSTDNKVLGSTSTTSIALSTAGGSKDILNFYYDGTNFFWNIGQGYGTASTSSQVNLTSSVTGTLPVANGGTGVTTLTGLVKGNGTNVMTAAVAGTDYQAPLTLTTTGTGAATISGTTLNIPTPNDYTLTTASASTLGGVKVGNNLSIDGSGVLSANINASSISGTVAVANGGTGVTSSTGTGSVVLSASPALTGTPTAPTATSGNNTTQIATTAFVTAAVAAGGGGGSSTYTTGLNSSLGGYVFYVTPDGKHGLVAETNEFDSPLYNANDKLKDPTYHSTDGKNFMDWRVPTLYELTLMYNMKTTLNMNNSNIYWSSTWWGGYSANSFFNKRMSDGVEYDNGSDQSKKIKAVRTF